MQYLAEIQKQSKGFMGGFETKLKLLASQSSDRGWTVEPGNKSIPIEDVGNLGDGALVMVNLGSNNQVQGTLEPASTRIIGILQSFSRLLEKSKSQEEEIETWKESLTIQSEQLSARELEMEARLEQLEQMEEEFQHFEAQRQEINAAREEAQRLKKEIEEKEQAISEKEARLAQNLKEGRFLDESQAAEIQNLLDSLSGEINSTGSLKEQLPSILSEIERQQEILTKHWHKLEQNQKNLALERQNYLQSQSNLKNAQEELKSLVSSINNTQQKLAKEQQLLDDKQKLITILTEQHQAQEKIQDSIDRAGIESSGAELGQKIDIKALESMPLSELEEIVANLQKDLEKVIQFVQDQEEELSWQSQAVEEIEQKIKGANEFDRLTLEQELAEEKEAKKMLDETLVGQRRSLKERHERFLQHSRILKRRQGVFDLEAELQNIDLEPIKDTLKQQQKKLLAQTQLLESEIIQIQQNISTLESDLQQKTSQQETLACHVQEQSDALEKQNLNISAMEAELNFYQESLQPLQDSLNQIRERLEKVNSFMSQNDDNHQNPSQVLTEIDRKIKELVNA